MLIFAHGLESGPQGNKSRLLAGLGGPFVAPDCRGMVLQARCELLERVTRPGGVLLCGSSYGGLVAALLAARHPERFTGLVLCAPALERVEPPNLDPGALKAPPGLPTVIIHGLQDTVVPLAGSRRYRDRSGSHVILHEVQDDHRLSGSWDLLVRVVGDLGR